MLEAILWDVGNVLLKLNFYRAHSYFMRRGGISQDQYGQIPTLKSENVQAFERGELSVEKFYQDFVHDLGIELERGQFEQIWNSIFRPNKPVLRWFEELSAAGVPCYGLSNTNALHYEYFMHNYPYFAHLKGIIASHKVGLLKPDRRIYTLTAERFSLNPPKTLFIDDREENIQAAGDLGFKTFQYRFDDIRLTARLLASFPQFREKQS